MHPNQDDVEASRVTGDEESGSEESRVQSLEARAEPCYAGRVPGRPVAGSSLSARSSQHEGKLPARSLAGAKPPLDFIRKLPISPQKQMRVSLQALRLTKTHAL